MTPEQQQIAIAEACGWKRKSVDPEYPLTRPESRFEKGELIVYHYGQLPDYLNDLDAMHKAEISLKDKALWLQNLQLVVLGRDAWADRSLLTLDLTDLISANAAQRAEAFLRTLNLWTES